MSEWQPIETAPKDGNSVIIYDPRGTTVCEAIYDKHQSSWVDPVETYYRYHPTHWMPLPAPPVVEGEE